MMVKRQLRRFWFLLLLIASFTSCQQEIDWAGQNFDYIPTSPGSTWRYTSSYRGKFDLEATTRDTIIDGFKFRIFNRLNYMTGQTVLNYYSKTGKTYRKYGSIGITQSIGDLIILKDTVVTATWTSTSGSTFIEHHDFTLAERDIQYTVNNVTYDNVIKLTYIMNLFDPNTGLTSPKGSGVFYYARGVGLIESICQGYFGPGIPPSLAYDTIRLYNCNIK